MKLGLDSQWNLVWIPVKLGLDCQWNLVWIPVKLGLDSQWSLVWISSETWSSKTFENWALLTNNYQTINFKSCYRYWQCSSSPDPLKTWKSRHAKYRMAHDYYRCLDNYLCLTKRNWSTSSNQADIVIYRWLERVKYQSLLIFLSDSRSPSIVTENNNKNPLKGIKRHLNYERIPQHQIYHWLKICIFIR